MFELWMGRDRSSEMLVLPCARRPFRGMPPLISCTRQEVSRGHQVTPKSRIDCSHSDTLALKCHKLVRSLAWKFHLKKLGHVVETSAEIHPFKWVFKELYLQDLLLEFLCNSHSMCKYNANVINFSRLAAQRKWVEDFRCT